MGRKRSDLPGIVRQASNIVIPNKKGAGDGAFSNLQKQERTPCTPQLPGRRTMPWPVVRSAIRADFPRRSRK